LIIIIIAKVENDRKQIVSLSEALMDQISRDLILKEFINILHAQFVTEDFVQVGKVILVNLEVTVELSLTILFASLIVEFNQKSDLKILILRFFGSDFSV